MTCRVMFLLFILSHSGFGTLRSEPLINLFIRHLLFDIFFSSIGIAHGGWPSTPSIHIRIPGHFSKLHLHPEATAFPHLSLVYAIL